MDSGDPGGADAAVVFPKAALRILEKLCSGGEQAEKGQNRFNEGIQDYTATEEIIKERTGREMMSSTGTRKERGSQDEKIIQLHSKLLNEPEQGEKKEKKILVRLLLQARILINLYNSKMQMK